MFLLLRRCGPKDILRFGGRSRYSRGMVDNENNQRDQQARAAELGLDDTREVELVELRLPDDDDIASLRDLAQSTDKSGSDVRASKAIADGLLKDLSGCFDPATRRDSPTRDNCISARIVGDMAALLARFDEVASALGYNPPAANQRRYSGPQLRLRYCRINQCDVAMTTIRWPIHLCGCKFTGPGMFMGSTFAARANFEHSVFEGGADFGLVKFQADTSFSGVAFTAAAAVSATFAGVTFCRHADFDLTRFAATVQFDYGTFEGQTRFFRAQFKGPAGFCETKFRAQALFEFTFFSDRADFSSAEFQAAPDFHEATFQEEVNFSSANFEQYLDLRGAAFGDRAALNIADLRIRASNVLAGNVRLSSTQLRSWQWWPAGWNSLLGSDSPRDIKSAARRRLQAALEHEGADRDDALREYDKALAGQAAALASACTQYGVLEENFRAQGDPDSRYSEDFCHYRYHDLWRRTHRRPYSPLYWSNWFFMKLCFGYGVYPLRVMTAGLMLIVFFAICYATGGFAMAAGTLDLETSRRVVDVKTGEKSDVALRLSQLSGWQKWTTALYFSTTTFTTIGYGDWRPVGAASFAAAGEGLLGVFTMSVFTVVFARKFVR